MSFSIKKNFKHIPVQEEVQMKAFSTALLTDSSGLRAAFVALTAKMDTDNGALNTLIDGITAKLDADAGITDTNYAATFPAAVAEVVKPYAILALSSH